MSTVLSLIHYFFALFELMHLFNRLLGYPRPKSIASEPMHTDENDTSICRITKRELLQCHRAQPCLTENLLIAAESGSRSDAATAPSMGCILEILQFSKKMKWLCEWGPEIVDESLRPPSADVPLCIQRKSSEMFFDKSAMRSRNEILELLRDPTQHWDRIMLPMYDPEFFKLFHLHPCQELWLIFYDEDLSLADMCNIAKCSNLRILSMGYNQTSKEGMQALQSLPNLRQVYYDTNADAFSCVEALSQLPQLNMIQIHPPNEDDEYHPMYFPFTDAHINVVSKYIEDRTNLTQHFSICGPIGALLFGCLGKFTKIQSISISGSICAIEENELDLLLKLENLHKTVRHISLGSNGIDTDAASSLAMFRNLLWLEFYNLLASTAKLVPAITANANNLISLSISSCGNVDDDILDEIAKCKRLQIVYLHETGVSVEAIKKYRLDKRPNWDKIMYEKTDFTTGIVYAIKSQGGEMEAYQDPHVLARIDAE